MSAFDAPILTNSPGVYTFEWEADGVMIEVDRFIRSRDTLKAEVRVLSTLLVETPTRVGTARVDLLSPTSRNSLAKECSAEDESTDWAGFVKRACITALELFRTGEPEHELTFEEEAVPLEYLLYPIIPEKQITILYGDGGIGKSILAQMFALIVSFGWADNPYGLRVKNQHRAGLILDWETDKAAASVSFRSLYRSFLSLCPTPEPKIIYRRCFLPLRDDLTEVQRIINRHSIEFVVMDSAAAACGGDPNAAEIASQFLGHEIRQLNTTTVLIAHTSKNQVGEKSVFGSVFFRNYARSVWEVKKHQEVGDNSLDIALFNRKSNLSRLQKPIGFRLDFEEDTIDVQSQDVEGIEGLQKELSVREQIAHLLKSGPRRPKDIAEVLESSDAAVCMALKRGPFTKLTDGSWGLLAYD